MHGELPKLKKAGLGVVGHLDKDGRGIAPEFFVILENKSRAKNKKMWRWTRNIEDVKE